MSSKGQVVIPEEVRNSLGLEPGAQFIVMGENDGVILKTLAPPAMSEFDGIVARARRQAKAAGMKPPDIGRAAARVRGRTRRDEASERSRTRMSSWTPTFSSRAYFSGPPATILRAWREGRITLVVSPPILEEYRRVMHELATQFPAVDPGPPLDLLAVHARLVEAPPLPETVCTDPTDEMFLACAIAGDCHVVVSGDKALLRTPGYRGVAVLTPRAFLSRA